MVRGEIYFMDLAPRSGSEQTGRRPCVVVSHNAFSTSPHWRSVTVVPFTTSTRWLRPSPTTVVFRAGESNLPKACAVLAHQITTIDKDKVVGPPIGRLSVPKLKAVEDALANYLLSNRP